MLAWAACSMSMSQAACFVLHRLVARLPQASQHFRAAKEKVILKEFIFLGALSQICSVQDCSYAVVGKPDHSSC